MTVGMIIYLTIGSVIAYGVVVLLRDVSQEMNYRYLDDRDTDERRIAGEDTSEVALNYLKIAGKLENDDETS